MDFADYQDGGRDRYIPMSNYTNLPFTKSILLNPRNLVNRGL